MAAVPKLGFIGNLLNLEMRQGATFGPYRVQLKRPVVPATDPPTYEPFDLTGWGLRGQTKKDFKKPKLFDITFAIAPTATEGWFDMSATDEQTKLFKPGNKITDADSLYVWDCEMYKGDDVRPLYYGDVSVLREITLDT